MSLLFQVVGILAGGIALSALAGAGPARRIPRASAGVALVAAGVASVLFWAHVWDVGKAFRDTHRQNAALTAFDAERAPGSAGGVNVAFLDWARARMSGDDTFHVLPEAARNDAFIYQWMTYQLIPHRFVERADEADWLVFYNTDPGKTGYDRRHFGPPVSFGPGLSIARRTDAS
jgi:hypothetical protein